MSKEIKSKDKLSNIISHFEMDLLIDIDNSLLNKNTIIDDTNPAFKLRFYPSMVNDNIRDNISTLTPQGKQGEQGRIYIPTTVKLQESRLKKISQDMKVVLNSEYYMLKYINSIPEKASLDNLHDIIEHNINFILELYLPPGGSIFLKRGRQGSRTITSYGFDKYSINFAKWDKYKSSNKKILELKSKIPEKQLEYDKIKSKSIEFDKQHTQSDKAFSTFIEKIEEVKAHYNEYIDEYNEYLRNIYNRLQNIVQTLTLKQDKGLGYIPENNSQKQLKFYKKRIVFDEDYKKAYLNPSNNLIEGPFLFSLKSDISDSNKMLSIFDSRSNDNPDDYVSLELFFKLLINRTEYMMQDFNYDITSYTLYRLKNMYSMPVSNIETNDIILSTANNTIHKINLTSGDVLEYKSIDTNKPTCISFYNSNGNNITLIGYSNGLVIINNNFYYPLGNSKIIDIRGINIDGEDYVLICSNENNIYCFKLNIVDSDILYNNCLPYYSSLENNISKYNVKQIINIHENIAFFTKDNFYYLKKDRLNSFNKLYPLNININKRIYHVYMVLHRKKIY